MGLHLIDTSVGTPDEYGYCEFKLPEFNGGLIVGFAGIMASRGDGGKAQSLINGSSENPIQVSISTFQGGRWFTLTPRTKFDITLADYGVCRVRYTFEAEGTIELHTFPPGHCPLGNV